MSTSVIGFGSILFTLPVLVGLWVGIVGLGRSDRGPAWWYMITGICCTTLGSIGSVIFVGLMMFGLSSPTSSMPYGVFSMMISGGLSGLGSLLFSIGFALQGLKSVRTTQRITELEAIAAAQGEELNRQRRIS